MPPQYRYITNILGNSITVHYFDDDGQMVKLDIIQGQRVRIKKDFAEQIELSYPDSVSNLEDGE